MARTNLGKIVMIPKGTYSTTVTYSKLDVVTSNGSGYISKSDNNLNKPLTNETYWMKLVEKGDKGDKGDSYIITEADIQEIEDYVVDKTSGQIIATRNELERVKNDVLETGTDTDTFVHLEDSAMAELQELEIEGVTKQTTTTGRNFLPSGVPKTETINNVIFSCDGNGKYTINGTASENTTCYFNLTNSIIFPTSEALYIHLRNTIANANIGFGLLIENNTYEPALSTIDRIVTSNKLQSGGTLLQVYIKIPANIALNFTLTPSVETSSTATDYEPYTGGQPSPSPDYPQEIKTITNSLKVTSCGKNLFDKENPNFSAENYNLNDNGELVSVGSWLVSQYLKVMPNTTYTLSGTRIPNTWMSRISQYDANKKHIIQQKMANTNNVFTFITNENTRYISFNVFMDVVDLNTIQLEVKSTATSYVDHLYSQITAKLPEGEFIGKFSDTNKDYVSLKYNKEEGQYHAVVNKYIGKGVLNGTEPGWGMSGTNVSNKNRFANSSMSSLMVAPAKDNEIANIISNKLVSKSAYDTYDNVNGISVNSKGTIYIYYDDIANYTPEEFKNWLSANQNEFYYLLATPYKIDLGVIDMPLSYNEVTNIFTDSDLLPKINAKYYRNFITTVQNLQVNEKSLKQELIDINTRLSALESANASITTESEVTE